MAQKLNIGMKLSFLIFFIQITCARYNNFDARYLSPRQTYYYEYDGFPAYYENDDVACPIKLDGDIYVDIDVDFKRSVLHIPTDLGAILYSVETGLYYVLGGPPPPQFQFKIRQTLAVEPPTVCPVLEVEIKIARLHVESHCFLMWDEFPGPYFGSIPPYLNDTAYSFVFFHPRCPDMDDPEDDVDNPKRIFTVVPLTDECDFGCLKFKLCPFQNTSCEVPAIALSVLGGHPRLNLRPV